MRFFSLLKILLCLREIKSWGLQFETLTTVWVCAISTRLCQPTSNANWFTDGSNLKWVIGLWIKTKHESKNYNKSYSLHTNCFISLPIGWVFCSYSHRICLSVCIKFWNEIWINLPFVLLVPRFPLYLLQGRYLLLDWIV